MESKGYRKLNLTHKSHLLYCFSAWVLVSIITTATTCQRDSRSQIDGSCTQTTVSTSTISTQLAIMHDNLNLALCFFSWTADFRFLPFAQAADSICSQVMTRIRLSQEIAQENQVSIPVDIQGHPSSLPRRVLSGPGSSPPRCASKCGKCTPCKPVHVPVPPGTPVTAEYYPEAWRCKCGNKLYMP
ncbi:hypothetical protein Gohar_003801 [Gossypium harknessii]|uniref:Epidermal patterning factor-like protein n=1 Tax=Gossypium harknessii TaxID=34285 RepID=A0A7J9IAV2_9ROSI|nr:hypothetical protein [Gossypium harknessii]